MKQIEKINKWNTFLLYRNESKELFIFNADSDQ
jgi:hypothetical protein